MADTLETQIVEAEQEQEDIADIFAVQKQVQQTLTDIAAQKKQPVFVGPQQIQKPPNYLLYVIIAAGVFLFVIKKR